VTVAVPGVAVVSAHARSVPAPDRQRLATALAGAAPAGSVVVITCHRVEAYLPAGRAGDMASAVPRGGRALVGEAAARHLVSVAVGRDSAVVGEDEILHQLRQSLEAARKEGPVDPAIDRLFAVALHAGRRARSWSQGRRRSLGDVAVEAIRTQRDGGAALDGATILVVGAGAMGSLAAHAATRAGAHVVVANRSADRARAVAAAVGGETVALDVPDLPRTIAGVIVALGARWSVEPATADALVARRTPVVDLSFPAAIADDLARRLGDCLVTADQLAADAEEPDREPAGARARVDELVESSVEAFSDWLRLGDSRAIADALVRHADRQRAAELDELWRQIPPLEPDTKAAIETMTRHLALSLLKRPLERLGRDQDGREGPIVRDLFAL
jgi:glutamyl-tRNA reductase